MRDTKRARILLSKRTHFADLFVCKLQIAELTHVIDTASSGVRYPQRSFVSQLSLSLCFSTRQPDVRAKVEELWTKDKTKRSLDEVINSVDICLLLVGSPHARRHASCPLAIPHNK
eukprot:TRINITY_DN14072_c0_g1_i1.p2 TRINITY_DN14072_c0_g1~~TRINITY_DN14072_c0_g1_i1.p2  ORF type:complete len:116 (-),score=10.29 TRINITY_DN14072_c0_g1_i1:72-419(-)